MRVVVSAPATSANLGPGFDCLGMALGLYHRVAIREVDGAGLELRAHGEGADQLPPEGQNLVCQGVFDGCERVGYRPRRLCIESANDIPLAAGLGSSAAAYLAGLAAGVLLGGGQLAAAELIEWGSEREGHADNVVPCVLGGFTVIAADREVRHLRLDPPAGVAAPVAIPNFELPTRTARTVLPTTVVHSDAVFNQSRVGMLAAAIASGRLELLGQAMRDRLHQPYREQLVPGLTQVLEAAMAAGSLGAALSGAGPSVLALAAHPDAARVGARMVQTWRGDGIEARCVVLTMDRRGLVARREPD